MCMVLRKVEMVFAREQVCYGQSVMRTEQILLEVCMNYFALIYVNIHCLTKSSLC